MTLFALTHLEHEYSSLQELGDVRPIHLNRLTIESPDQNSPTLAENRFFLSKEALEIRTDSAVGIISPKAFERYPFLGDFRRLSGFVDGLSNEEFWCAEGPRVLGDKDLRYWIANQDAFHPGLGEILNFVKSEMFNSPARGTFVLGNHFALPRNSWIDFIHSWRQAMSLVQEKYGQDVAFSFRCANCLQLRPNGYFRYGASRKLGFVGERLSALILSHSELELRQYGALSRSSSFRHIIGGLPDKLIDDVTPRYLIARRYPLRSRCRMCQIYNPEDPRYGPASSS